MKKKQAFRRQTAEETASFFGRLAMSLSAGISVQEAIGLLREGEGDALADFLAEKTAAQRLPLHQALSETAAFPEYAVDMVAVGEMTGRLDEVCGRLAEYYAREDAHKNRLRSTLLYPAVLAAMLAAVLFVLITEVLPIFNRVFAELGLEMTGIAGWFLRMGQWAGFVLLGLLLLCGAAVVTILTARKGRKTWQNFLERSFLTRRLYEKIAISRMASSLALAVASGKNTDEALEIAETMTAHKGLLARMRQAKLAMLAGESMAGALRNASVLSPLQANLLAVGIKSGQTDQVLARLAENLDEEADQAASNMLSLVEPVLVTILSVVVGLILLSALLPLLSVMSSIG